MKKLDLLARNILALFLLMVGTNKFLHFMSMPPPTNEISKAYMKGLAENGFFFPMLGGIYIAVAILLFVNRAVGLGLVVLASIVFNILIYHFGMGEAAGGLFAVIFAFLVAFLALIRRQDFASLFK